MESNITAYAPMPRQMYIAKEGHFYIVMSLAATAIAGVLGNVPAIAAFLSLSAFITFFFRNPQRRVPDGHGQIVASADGRILSVGRAIAPETGDESIRVCTFMSVLNVHVNRFPVKGVVRRAVYHAGQFLVASLDKASEKNERNTLVIEDECGRKIVLVQIAGLVARRIVCYLREGDILCRGDRLGLIRFGSRVDVYLPPGTNICVKPGDRVRAGETVIGRFE